MLGNARHPRFACEGVLLATLAGCPAGEADAPPDPGSSSGAASTSEGDDDDESSSAAATTDDGSTSDGGSSSGAIDTSSGGDTGAAPIGRCHGWHDDDFRGDVWARVGSAADFCEVEPEPCGGDPIGEWELMRSCGYEEIPPLANPWCGILATYGTREGTLSFEDGGHFVLTTYVEHTGTWEGSPLCLDLGTNDCDRFAAPVVESVLGGEAGCHQIGLDCECSIAGVVTDEVQRMGVYGLGPSVLVFDAGPDAQPIHPFCIDHDRLDLWTPPDLGTPTDIPCTTDEECHPALLAMFDVVACVPGS